MPEHKKAMATIQPVVDDHKKKMVVGVPALNKCDPAVQVNQFSTFTAHNFLITNKLIAETDFSSLLRK